MGKVLYINAIKKPEGASETFRIPGSFIATGRQNHTNNNPLKKYTFQFAETDKYLDYFSVSSWLNKRKKGSKYRTKR